MRNNGKVFIYIRGLPGSGKITVARLLKKKLQNHYHLFWYHDLKDAVRRIVGDLRIPLLMDEVTKPIIKYLIQNDKNIIYTRASSRSEGVKKIKNLVEKGGYKFYLITLTASYEELVRRLSKYRGSQRPFGKSDLDGYLDIKPKMKKLGTYDFWIDTTQLSPKQVTNNIMERLKL